MDKIDQNEIPSQSRDELEKLKLLHEIQKLKTETDLHKKSWWKQAPYLNLLAIIISPALAIFLSYIFVGKEYLDITKLKNEYDKEKITDDLKLLNEKKDSLSRKNDSLYEGIKSLSSKKDSLIQNNKLLIDENNSLLATDLHFQKLTLKLTEDHKRELHKKEKEFEEEKQLIPIRMILENIANIVDEIKINTDDKTYELLINKLKVEKNNKVVIEYIESYLSNNDINAKSKTEAMIASYFATKNSDWKKRLMDYVKEDVINRYSNKLHWKLFKATELHENNVFVIHSIIKINDIDKINQVKLNDILGDVISFQESQRTKSKISDTLLTPAKDYLAFIDFLKAYRHVNIDFNELPKRSNPISNKLSNWILPYTVYMAVSIKQETEKNNGKEYLQKINPSGFGNGIISTLRQKWLKIISSDFSRNPTVWVEWLKKNEGLVNRLMEKNFDSYRNDQELLLRDFKEL